MSGLFVPGDRLQVRLHRFEVRCSPEMRSTLLFVSKQVRAWRPGPGQILTHDAQLKAVVEVIPTGAQWLGDRSAFSFQDDDEVEVLRVEGPTLTCMLAPTPWSTAAGAEVRLQVLRHYYLPLYERWPRSTAVTAALLAADLQATTADPHPAASAAAPTITESAASATLPATTNDPHDVQDLGRLPRPQPPAATAAATTIAESAATADVQAAPTDTQDLVRDEWQHVELTMDAGGSSAASEADAAADDTECTTS